jgi:nicotinamidase-related amidase
VTRKGTGVALGPIDARPYAWPYDGEVSPRSLAVLSIDWQGDWINPGGVFDAMGFAYEGLRVALEPTAIVLEAARYAGATVIHTREGHEPGLTDCPPIKQFRMRHFGAPIGDPGSGGRMLIRGEPGWEIVDEVKPVPGDWIIDKPGKSAFFATDLELRLRTQGITHLVMMGITTDVCVTSTLRDASDRGYESLLLEDCTADLTPEQTRICVENVTRSPFGAVATSEAFLGALIDR